MTSVRPSFAVVLIAILLCLTGWVAAEASPQLPYGKLPLSFEANHGQTDPSVEFVARSTGYQLFLTRNEAVLVLRRPGTAAADTLRMALVDATPARPHGVDQLPGTVNYLLGRDSTKWRTSIPIYAKVRARDVYPGVDLVYYGNQRQLEYDFVVAPGADPAAIRLAFQGLVTPTAQRALVLDESGDLTLRVPGGDVRLKRPVAYQEDANGTRNPVNVAFALVPALDAEGSWHVGFQVGAYDRAQALVIDPVVSYAAYLGESDADAGMAIAVRDGEAYVTGYTESLTFPSAGVQPNQPLRDAFVAKMNASGSGLVYATYLGGDGADAGMGIAVDPAGQAYVTGYTESTDFPTVPATPLFGNQGGRDAFVTKLNAAGTAFLYSTYLGGGLEDIGLGIAVDTGGNAYVTGWTESTDFPTTGSSLQTDQPERDAFVTKIDSTGTALLYSTYLGGDGIDEGQAIAVDASGLAYVTGDTTSTNLPTTTANTRPPGGGEDAFVAKLDPGAVGAASRIYLTYFGGSAADGGRGVAVDSLGSILITGVTSSTNLPVKFAFQGAYGGGNEDAFVAKFNPAGAGPNAALQYASFLGGLGDDAGHGIAVDTEDQAFIIGSTTSANFPTLHGLSTGLGGPKDAFVAKFDPADPGVPSLRYSTYLGGNGEDEGYGIAVDSAGSAYVVGLTRSGDFPSAIGGLSGTEDAFVAKLGEPDLEVPVFTVPASGGAGEVISVTDTTRNTGVATAVASTTSFYLSTDNKLDPSDTLLGSRAVPELPPDEESTLVTELTLPASLTPGSYFLFARADDENAIGESFESNNRTRRTFAIGADLAVTTLTATSSGLTLTVADTTKNVAGAALGTSTTTKFFLVGPGGEVLLGSRTVGPLAAGEESTVSTDLPIPPGTTSGSYTVVARADADGAVAETSETNNEKSTPFTVGADLLVSALTVPGLSGAGSSISVTPTIQNRGAVASGNSTTEFFLSTTGSVDGTAVSIGTQLVPELAPGATSAVAVSVTIPASTTPGSYFIVAKANSVTPIAETNVNNNTRARTSVVGPDLTISFVSPSSTTSGPGKNVTFKDTTRNIGGGNAAASVTKFYLSNDATFDAGDIELGQRSVPTLAPGADHFNSAGVSLTIPANTTAGSYFIIARANAGATPIGETNTTNNTSSGSVAVAGGDLVVSVLTVSFSGTSTVSITDTTRNQGTSPAGASVTRFHLSTDATFDEATDPVLGERAVGELIGGASSEATTTVSLPGGTAAGTYTIFARADATGVVTESDESNNRRSRTIDTRGSDLIIPNLSFTFGDLATLNVVDTTRNEGPATAGASQTRFYLSTDASLDPGDVALGSRNVVSLAATNQSTTSTPVSIPATTVGGDYFLIARADDAAVVGEVNEGNNTTSRPISIKTDLIVDSLNLPSGASVGTAITASGTVRNNGPIPAVGSALKFYLSTDATLDGADTLLQTSAFSAVGAGRSESFSIQITMPNGTAGTVFVIAKIDADEQILESNEGNNTRAKSIAVGSDLIISAFSGVPAAAGAGGSFTVSDTTRNLAAAPVDPSVTRFYLSADNVFDPTDVPIGSRPVPGLGARRTHSGNTPVTIPQGTTSGTYFVIAVADADQQHTEASEANNTAVAAIVIGSDLVVSAVGASFDGTTGTITVTDTTTNQGGSQAGPSTTKFYLSTNTTFEAGDILLGSRAITNGLAAGTSSNGSTDFAVPAGTPSNTYFVVARADADGVVGEVDESNNARASGAVVIGTDLVVSALTVPRTAGLGASLSITSTVTNAGGTQAGESVVKFFLSTDTVLDPNDSLLGTRLVSTLAPGGTSSGPTTVTIPVDTSNGTFFVIAQADGGSQVSEVNETNNTLAVQLRVGADLRISSLSAPAEGAVGGLINIKETTRNDGAPSGSSVTRIYLSTNDVLDVGVDTLLASRTVPPLGRGDASSGNFDVTLPAGLPAGTYFIIVQADAMNAEAEAVEDNNLRSRSIVLGPDYVISSVTGPSEGGAGLLITIGATTKNEGAASAATTVTEFYVSTDRTLAGANVLLGSRPVPQLGAGNSNGGTVTVTLPATLAPGQYFIVAKANAGGVSESDTTNNLRDRSITIGPDLVVSSFSVPTPLGSGVPFTVTDTTRNDTAGAAATSTTSYFLSSTDDVLDASDVLLGSRTVPELGPGASHSASTPLTIPNGTPDGPYFIIARANEPNTVAELNTGNNEKARAIRVGPDLVMSTVTAPTSATAGTDITVTATITNSGPGAAGTFTVKVYLSTNEVFEPGIDPEVGNRVVAGLAADTADTGPISVAIPAGISGPHVLIVIADADGVINELRETNNTRQKSLNVLQ